MNIASATAMAVSIHGRNTERPIASKTTARSGVSQLTAAMAMPHSPTHRSFLLVSILSYPNRLDSEAGLSIDMKIAFPTRRVLQAKSGSPVGGGLV
jgi:hypothetical protein